MTYVYNDGGRSEAGFKGSTGDCACRAVAIAVQVDYREVYNLINEFAKNERRKKKSNARSGVWRDTLNKVLAHYGYEWVPTMKVGQGVTTHLNPSELPEGRIVVRLSGHFCAVINGVIHDTFDPSYGGARAVYGYWRKS